MLQKSNTIRTAEIFFLEPEKEHYLMEISRRINLAHTFVKRDLDKLVKSGLIKKADDKKGKRKFPYFTAGENNSAYYSLKRVYALEELHKSGVIPELLSADSAKTIIIFGSMMKGDWYKNSDVDIFVFGNLSDFNSKVYEKKLHRNIELHIFHSRKEIEKVKTCLMKNVINAML